MAKELTVFQKMTASTAALIQVMADEVGVKCCQPFAIRAYDALKELKLTTEDDAKRAANTFLDNWQTLVQGGITSEDYDKIDFVKRGNAVTISARVQALLRAFRRKGFTVVETIIGVPQGDDIYFEEEYKDGVGIIYLLKDARVNTDRKITAKRLTENYFDKYICRLVITNLQSKTSLMVVSEMTNEEVMNAQSSSENGIYLSEWVEVTNAKGEVVYKDKNKTIPKKRKVIYDGSNGTKVQFNKDSTWVKWTSQMVEKTVMRRALKNVKETIPELRDTIMAFDTDVDITPTDVTVVPKSSVVVEGYNNVDIKLETLSEEQLQDVQEVYEIYVQNPANAACDAEKIKELYESGTPINEIINEYYAELVNLSKSKKLYPLVENVIKGVPYEKNEN